MKKLAGERRARAIYERLSGLPREDGLTYNEWALRAGVNTSFFTNLKNGSEPSVGNLRAILEAVGTTLPEFFVQEAVGRVMLSPDPQALERAFQEALPGLPKRLDRRAQYLAEVVQAVLGLPKDHHAKSDASYLHSQGESDTAKLVLASTK